MIESDFEYSPWSEQSEQVVLGTLLTHTEKFIDVSDILSANDFYSPANMNIYRAFEVLSETGKPIDVPIVISYLGEQGVLELVGGMAYLMELAQLSFSSANLLAYAGTVKQKAQERQVLQLADKMQETIKDPDIKTEDKVNASLGLVSSFDVGSEGEKTKDEILKNVILNIEQNCNQQGLSGVDCGYLSLNNRFHGLQPSDLIILAARPSMGKTTFAMNIAEYVATNDTTGCVLAFSLEMSAEQLMMKSLCSIGKINLQNLKKGTCTEDEYSRMNPAMMKLKNSTFEIDDRAALSIQQVRAKALKMKRKHGRLKLIVVDYLTLLKDRSVGSRASRTEEIGSISRNLKALAKECDCPVIALSQLNRKVEERSDKRPKMSDLRDSGEIEQDADIIMFLYRDEVYNEQTPHPNICECITAKNRNGECGTDYLLARLHQSRFENHTAEIKIEEQKNEFSYKSSV